MDVVSVSANLGGFEKNDPGVDVLITEKEFPLRDKSITPRLQARIVKTHMWQFAPEHEYYLWVDSSCKLKSKQWFLDQLGDADIAVFKHPHRNTVQEEADYLKERLAKNCPYITPRYENEDIDGQLRVVEPDAELYASTAFITKGTQQAAMMNWWSNISRYHSIDQLSLPWASRHLKTKVIQDNYEDCEGIEFVRNKK